MRVNIKIAVDDDAFGSGNLSDELSRIIDRHLKLTKFQSANKVRVEEDFEIPLKDTNGDIVGRVEVSKFSSRFNPLRTMS